LQPALARRSQTFLHILQLPFLRNGITNFHHDDHGTFIAPTILNTQVSAQNDPEEKDVIPLVAGFGTIQYLSDCCPAEALSYGNASLNLANQDK
jgi:hypothetical protein